MEQPQPLPPSDKLYCFMDHNRFCTADCMAYAVVPLPHLKELHESNEHCLLIPSIVRGGFALYTLAAIADVALKLLKVVKADAARGAPPAPPDPMGRPR